MNNEETYLKKSIFLGDSRNTLFKNYDSYVKLQKINLKIKLRIANLTFGFTELLIPFVATEKPLKEFL